MADTKDKMAVAVLLSRFQGSELPMAVGADRAAPDWAGFAQLRAGQLVRPGPFNMIESASIFNPVSVLDRKMRLFLPGQRRIFNYCANPLLQDGATTLARKMHSVGTGYIDLPKGEWLVNTPIVVAEGTQIECVLQDAALGNEFDTESATGDAPGAPSAPIVAALTWTTFPQLVIAAADSAVLAANANRRAYSLFNASAGGQRIAITTENPATAVTRGILFLDPGQGYVSNPNDGTTKAILRGFASAAGALLNMAEGV